MSNLDIILGRTTVKKNSREFDQALLDELKGTCILTDEFETAMRKWFKAKSSCKLWFDNKPTEIWDGKEYHKVNFRCCPSSHNARYMFCLILDRDRNDEQIQILDGWLEAI